MKQQYTRSLIADTFRRMLETKPFERITVKEIVEECGLTRNTFYYYYDDIYDIVDEILCSEAENLTVEIDEDTSLSEAMKRAVALAVNEPGLVRAVFRSQKSEELKVYFSRAMETVIAGVFEARTRGKEVSERDRRIIIDSFRFAFEGALEKWVAQGMKTPIAEEIERMAWLFEGSFGSAIAKSIIG